MPTVKMTDHLYRFFPQLKDRTVTVPAGSVAQVLAAVNGVAPGFTDYVLDDRGAMRRHVKLSINNVLVFDSKSLSDQVLEDDTLFVFQSLTGG